MKSNKRKTIESLNLQISSNKRSKHEQDQLQSPYISTKYPRKTIASDGNCLFRSIAYSLFESEDMHEEIRKNICEYVENNRSGFDASIRIWKLRGYPILLLITYQYQMKLNGKSCLKMKKKMRKRFFLDPQIPAEHIHIWMLIIIEILLEIWRFLMYQMTTWRKAE